MSFYTIHILIWQMQFSITSLMAFIRKAVLGAIVIH